MRENQVMRISSLSSVGGISLFRNALKSARPEIEKTPPEELMLLQKPSL